MSGEQTKAAEPLAGTRASVYLPEQSGTMIRSEGLVSLVNQEITNAGGPVARNSASGVRLRPNPVANWERI